MFEKICFLVFDNLYSSKRHFTRGLADAFDLQGSEVLILDIEGGVLGEKDLEKLAAFDPTCTFSYNTMQPMKDGNYLWDALKTPHILAPLDPMIYYLEYVHSPYCYLAYVDRKDEAVLKGAHFEGGFFMPHAIERELLTRPVTQERDYDVVLIGSCYDHETVRSTWQKKLSPDAAAVVERAIERAFADPTISFLEAIAACWEESKLDPRQVNFQKLAFYVDYYMRGYDRIKLLEALENFKVAVFGSCFWIEGEKLQGWSHYTEKMPHVTAFEGVSFEESLDLLARSRVCLNSTPFFRDGSHERFLTALALGCSVVATENRYGREVFGAGQGVEWYSTAERSTAAESVAKLLEDEGKRLEEALLGRQIVAKEHTFDARVTTMKNTL